MSQLIDSYKQKVKPYQKTIVLPEGEDIRVISAAQQIAKEGFVKLVVLGDENQIAEKAKGYDLSGVEIINPKKSPRLQEYADFLYELRKEKGVTPEKALELVSDVMYYAVMMVKCGHADGMVGGAVHSTSDLLRPALQIVKTVKGVKTVSGFFIMENQNHPDEKLRQIIFADCAITPAPTSSDLADIAICSERSARAFLPIEPKVAMLSFSTKGSAKHERISVVSEAVQIVKERHPDMAVDGELQFDAAVVPEVGKLKCPTSKVAGEANVFVFPDLGAGNIGYKIAQRLGGYNAYGPICQGMAAPCNDLSRGCSADDIVAVVAITALQAVQQA
ncbi:MAG: phosphate acetyltransferase [Clostridia bacterium]|nr:phosphate acetyltransferase [Clostridia bacterium]